MNRLIALLRRFVSFSRDVRRRCAAYVVRSVLPRIPRLQHAYLEFRTRVTERERLTVEARDGRAPVFLIAGWAASARGWIPFKTFLEERGYAVYLPTDHRNLGSVPELAEDIALRLRAIAAPRVSIVAHSLGGLTILHAILADPTLIEKIDRIILLGTPLRGTILGWLAPWERAFSHLRFERRRRRLERDMPMALKKKIHLLTARWDEVITPRPHLAGAAENTRLSIGGHLSLVLHPDVWAEVERRLCLK